MRSFHLTGDALWKRMERAVEKVQERLERTAAALEKAGVQFIAKNGGNRVPAPMMRSETNGVTLGEKFFVRFYSDS